MGSFTYIVGVCGVIVIRPTAAGLTDKACGVVMPRAGGDVCMPIAGGDVAGKPKPGALLASLA